MNSELKHGLLLEHREMYEKLEFFLNELVKVKNKRDDHHLSKTTRALVEYVDGLLQDHFQVEERDLFPALGQEYKEIVERLLIDHDEIIEKNQRLQAELMEFQSGSKDDFDYQNRILFPAYNLVATINHHALREDRELLSIEATG